MENCAIINKQKGVSLIITFFIMTIILAMVIIISTILYSQIKVIRNVGDSVIAFFQADSGVESTLYYDRKVVATGTARGICDFCTNDDGKEDYNGDCPDMVDSIDCECYLSSVTGTDGCDPTKCSDCIVSYNTYDKKGAMYTVTATTSESGTAGDEQPDLTINSTGFYPTTSRAINLDVKGGVTLGPTIKNPSVTPGSQKQGADVIVSATISELGGTPIDTVTAYIKSESAIAVADCNTANNNADTAASNFDNTCSYTKSLPCVANCGSDKSGDYSTTWETDIPGVYDIYIKACDTKNDCVQDDPLRTPPS